MMDESKWKTLDEIYNNRFIDTNESVQKILNQLCIFVEKLSEQIESTLYQDLTKQNSNLISIFCDEHNPLKRSFLMNPEFCQEMKTASYCAPNVCNEIFKNDVVFQQFWFRQIFKMTKSNLVSRFKNLNQSIGIKIDYIDQSIAVNIWQTLDHPISALNKMLKIDSKIDEHIDSSESTTKSTTFGSMVEKTLNDLMPKLKNIVNDL